MDKKSISVVLPNYNGRKLLETYLPSTFQVLEAAGVAFEVIIVDDASKDDSVDFIKRNYPEVKLIVNPQNRGFAYTCNRGIEASNNELILLLNSDVKLETGYFDQQWQYFTFPDTFGVMGRIIDMEGDRIQDAARMPKFNGLKLKTDYFYFCESPEQHLYTIYLSGANALVDAAKLKLLGGFDEIFSPLYCEDMELSLRAWRIGWKCYYEHKAVCRHQVSATTKNYQTARWVKSIYFRNRLFMHAIHLEGLARFAWYCQILVVDLLPRLLAGHFWIWQSYRGLFKNGRTIKGRRESFKQQLFRQNSTMTVFDVVDFLRSSIKAKKITRFKP